MPWSYIVGLGFLTLGLGLIGTKMLGVLASLDAAPYLFAIFDHTTSLYTLARLTVEPYNPFKPQLQMHKLTYYFRIHNHRLTGKLGADKRCNFEKGLSALLHSHELIPVALSIQYSFSDWNQNYIKLIDLRHHDLLLNDKEALLRILDRNIPQYNPLNHDFSIDVLSNEEFELTKNRKASIAANLEAYVRRATTWDAEQALHLLRELPELFEFLYPQVDRGIGNVKDVDAAFIDGEITFVAADELGTEFEIVMKNQKPA